LGRGGWGRGRGVALDCYKLTTNSLQNRYPKNFIYQSKQTCIEKPVEMAKLTRLVAIR
jgi:hypothetical protein